MNLFLFIFVLFLALWFLGVGAVAYHVNKYASPGDKLLLSFFTFFVVAAASFLWAISFVLGAL